MFRLTGENISPHREVYFKHLMKADEIYRLAGETGEFAKFHNNYLAHAEPLQTYYIFDERLKEFDLFDKRKPTSVELKDMAAVM